MALVKEIKQGFVKQKIKYEVGSKGPRTIDEV